MVAPRIGAEEERFEFGEFALVLGRIWRHIDSVLVPRLGQPIPGADVALLGRLGRPWCRRAPEVASRRAIRADHDERAIGRVDPMPLVVHSDIE